MLHQQKFGHIVLSWNLFEVQDKMVSQMTLQIKIMKYTLKALKTSKNSFWSNVFWYVYVYISWNLIQYTIHWDKTQVLFPSDKINVIKNSVFFLSHFTFNLQFLYELKHKVRLSKSLCWIFHFRLLFVFIKVCIFV